MEMIKMCGCGKAFTKEEWNELPFVGIMANNLELRNCSCGSTISIQISKPEEIEMKQIKPKGYIIQCRELFQVICKTVMKDDTWYSVTEIFHIVESMGGDRINTSMYKHYGRSFPYALTDFKDRTRRWMMQMARRGLVVMERRNGRMKFMAVRCSVKFHDTAA